MRIEFRRLAQSVVAASFFVAFVPAVHAALVYQQTFDGGDGTEDSGSGVGGNLVATGSGATIATFATTSGVAHGDPLGLHGQVLDVTSNTGSTRAGTARAASNVAGGSTFNWGGTGIMTDYTVTMWINVAEFCTPASTLATRMIVVGDTGTTDANQAGTFSLTQASANATVGVKTGFNVFLNTTNITSAGAIGVVNSVGEWTFVAISFDAAAGNDFFYRGTQTSPISSTALTVASTSVTLGAAGGVVLLGNNNGGGAAVDGLIDDVRIYNTALTSGEIESIRQELVPEPGACVLAGVGLIGFTLLRKRQPK